MSLIGKRVRFKAYDDDDDKKVILEGEVVDKIRVYSMSNSNEDNYVISAKDEKSENEIFIVDPYDLIKIIKDLKE